ncbi:MAG: hypothetical protein ABEI98_00820 [Halorhabdus sp.]
MLMVALVVLGVSIVGVALVANQQDRAAAMRVPAEMTGTVEASWATVTHTGGRAISFTDLTLLIRGASGTTRYDLAEPTVTVHGDGDGMFEAAETVNVSHSYRGTVELVMVDTRAPGRVIYQESFQVPADGGGMPAGVTIARFEVADTSGGGDAEYNVTWRATDGDSDITSATVKLVDQESGTVVDSQSYSFSNTGDTGLQTTELTNSSGSGRVYILNLTVTDAAGHTVTETKVDTADSEFGLREPVIQSFTVVDTTSGNTATYDATYNVSDPDGDLAEVTLELIATDTGNVVDSITDSYNDTTATGSQTRTLSAGKGTKGQTFYINMTATDADSRSATASVTDTANGGGGGGGGAKAPTIQLFEATDLSNCGSGQKQTEYEVAWNITDSQSDLDSVVVELIDAKGKQITAQTYDVAGGQAARTTVLAPNKNLCGDTVTIKITATDTAGNTASDAWTDTVNGAGTN